MSKILTRNFIILQVLASILLSAVSCNKKEEESENTIVVTSAIVAVKNFHFQANKEVLEHLDSVFFSIDLERGVIFNADSLPKGTDVSKLVPSITFANAMTKAELIFKKDNLTESTSDYLTSPSDEIDFSGPVFLDVTAADGISSFTYQIRVNVHKENPDSLVWNRFATAALPSRYPGDNPLAQKTVKRGDIVYTLVEERNGEFSLASCNDLNEFEWSVSQFSPGFTPDVSTLNAGETGFYILSDSGRLYFSEDTMVWEDTNENWSEILGAYGEGVMGITYDGTAYYHAFYPSSPDFIETELPSNFPISDYSELGIIESKWAQKPIAILMGGILANGSVSSDVWGFDGNNWAIINSGFLPALRSPMMTRYYVYRATQAAFKKREFEVWLLFGGDTVDGVMNREVYLSYDNGVHWILAPETMQLSDKIPYLAGGNLIVEGSLLSADLSQSWAWQDQSKSRAYTLDGFDIYWDCPYLYIFGGYLPLQNNVLNTSIYRGVLEKLKFVPDI